jgi:antitoxin PrlF
MSRIETSAKLTSKSQTTLPIAVRKALAVGPQDRIIYTILEGGRVEVRKAEDAEGDPVVRKYLAFLERDMLENPQKLNPVQSDPSTKKLLEGVETEDFDLSE